MQGTFVLTSRFENFNEKYIEAQKARRLLVEAYNETLEEHNIDFLLSPTMIGKEPPQLKDLQAGVSPTEEYEVDWYTCMANAVGSPAITLPIWEQERKWPGSVHLQGYFGEDYHLLRVAKWLEETGIVPGRGTRL